MLRAYEAVCRKGRLEWVRLPPDLAEGTRLLLLIEDRNPREMDEQGCREVLGAAWGAWGTRKTSDEVDEELDASPPASCPLPG
jgi:hypothetical protein